MHKAVFLFVFLCPVLLLGQIQLIPIGANSHDQNLRITTVLADTLRDLPFWDDFSSGTASEDLWEDSRNVFINNSLPINPPTQFVASFDGVNGNGSPYQPNSTFSGLGDELTSKPIDLSGVPESKRNTVYLSFFWQAQGLGEQPDERDSIRLQFMANDTTWVTQDINPNSNSPHLNGGTDAVLFDVNGNQVFQQVLVPVSGDRYFHAGFKFRFQSFSSVTGIYDTWHIDYVYLNQDRDNDDEFHFDRSFSGQQTSLFFPYREIPINQLRSNPEKYIRAPQAAGSNLSDIFFPMEINHTLENKLNGSSKSSGFLLKGQQSPQEFGNGFEGISLEELDLSGDSAEITSTFIYKSGDKNLFEVVGSNNDTLFLDVDLRANDTLRQSYSLKNFFAYDDGTAEYAAGVNLIGGELAVGFYLEDTARLTDILIYFPSINPSSDGQSIEVKVWKEVNNSSFPVRQQPTTIEAQGINDFQRISLSTPIVLSDSFFIGFQQFTNNYIGVGFDRNSPGGSNAMFSNTDRGWIRNDRLNGSLMIRPVFNESESVLSIESSFESLRLYPNPVSDILFTEGSFEKISIYDMFGKSWLSGEYSKAIDVSSLPPGLYVVRLLGNGETTQHKLLIER